MDGNGHSPVWGLSSVTTNPQGVLFEHLLASEELLCINAPGSPPTFVGDNGSESWIDVFAVSYGMLEQVINWWVAEESGLGSDHALLLWELAVQSRP